MAFIANVGGLVLIVAPSSHSSHFIDQIELLHLSGFLFEPGSELQFGTLIDQIDDFAPVVSGVVFELGSGFVHFVRLANGNSGPGSESRLHSLR